MAYRNCFICTILTSIIAAVVLLFAHISYASADLNSSQLARLSQNIEAEHIYENKSIILNSSIKNLIILIPNEAHESLNQPKNQLPLTNQPYLPQNAIVRTGTALVWFNDDVGHDHKVTVKDKDDKMIYQSPKFEYNTIAGPLILNESGNYMYYEENVNENDPSFTMKGTINVVVDKLSDRKLSSQDSRHVTNKQTIGMFMVPAIHLPKYVSEFGDNGLALDSTYTYEDLRGGQKGTGPKQSLIVWSSESNFDKILSELVALSSSLPYN